MARFTRPGRGPAVIRADLLIRRKWQALFGSDLDYASLVVGYARISLVDLVN